MLAYLGDVNLLDLIEYIHHGLKSYYELAGANTHIVDPTPKQNLRHTEQNKGQQAYLNIVVHNLKEHTGAYSNVIDDLMEGQRSPRWRLITAADHSPPDIELLLPDPVSTIVGLEIT